MQKLMGKDWDELMDGQNVNEMWSCLKELLNHAMSQHVPMKKNRRTDEPKWLDAEMRNKIGEKRRAWKTWKETSRATDKAVYTRTEKECKRMIRNKKNAFVRDITKNRNSNPKMYYSYINSANKKRCG